jgi:hypothetical protein
MPGSARRSEWVARLAEAKRHNSLDTELRRLSFVPLLVVDEVGYIPFDPEAANLMFSLVSARYERASLIVTARRRPGRVRLVARAPTPARDPRLYARGPRVTRSRILLVCGYDQDRWPRRNLSLPGANDGGLKAG